MSQNILLVSDLMIKERTAIHGNIDPKLIYPDIKAAQDMYIEPILGTALFNKLLSIVDDDSINTDAVLIQYKNLLDRYIADTLILYTLKELPLGLSYQFWNKGVVRKTGDNTELPSMSDLIDLSNRYKDRAEFYAERLRKYLMQYASQYFSEYLNGNNTIDSLRPGHKAFTNPIYLGDTKDPYCNDMGFNGKPYSDV
jgi:hypothetical protein